MSWDERVSRRVADLLALVYHEARNVRHLVKGGYLEPAPYARLISLPVNRDEAWHALHELRSQAASSPSPSAAAEVFESRLRLGIDDLIVLYANDNWRSSPFGGNPWRAITIRVAHLMMALESSGSESEELLAEVAKMRHNTGTVGQKLAKLQRRMDGES